MDFTVDRQDSELETLSFAVGYAYHHAAAYQMARTGDGPRLLISFTTLGICILSAQLTPRSAEFYSVDKESSSV